MSLGIMKNARCILTYQLLPKNIQKKIQLQKSHPSFFQNPVQHHLFFHPLLVTSNVVVRTPRRARTRAEPARPPWPSVGRQPTPPPASWRLWAVVWMGRGSGKGQTGPEMERKWTLKLGSFCTEVFQNQRPGFRMFQVLLSRFKFV